VTELTASRTPVKRRASFRLTSHRIQVLLSLAGAVVVAVLAAWIAKTLVVGSADHQSSSPSSASTTPTIPPPSSPADIAAFLAAERRMLFGTWVIHADFVRRTAAGRQLVSAVRRAQRPPDTLNQGPSTADGRRDGRLLTCATGPSGGLVCKDAGPAPPFADQVNSELNSLKSYLVAPLPLYRVGPAPGAGPGQCWRLLVAAPRYPSPPYGTQAVFCFDPATGAPSFSQVVRPEATDTTQVSQIDGAVTDADLTVGR
jgi:hypothetical protein